MRDGRLQAVDWDEHAAGEVKRSGHADIVTGGRRAAIGQLDDIRTRVLDRLSIAAAGDWPRPVGLRPCSRAAAVLILRTAVRRLLPYIRPHRRTIVVGIVLGMLANASALAEPLAAREVIESLADDGRSSLRPVLLLAGLVLISALLAGVQLWMLDRVAERSR